MPVPGRGHGAVSSVGVGPGPDIHGVYLRLNGIHAQTITTQIETSDRRYPVDFRF